MDILEQIKTECENSRTCMSGCHYCNEETGECYVDILLKACPSKWDTEEIRKRLNDDKREKA